MAGHGDGAPPSHSEDQQMFPRLCLVSCNFLPSEPAAGPRLVSPGGLKKAGVGVERAVTCYSQPCTLPPIVKWPWIRAKQEAASNLWPGAWGVRPATDSSPFQ